MERDEHSFPSDETLLSQAERMRKAQAEQDTEEFEIVEALGETALTPTEEEIAKTVCPDQLRIELNIPPERGWRAKTDRPT